MRDGPLYTIREACTGVDCGKGSNVQGKSGGLNEMDLTEGCKLEGYCVADLARGLPTDFCHVQNFQGELTEVELVESAADVVGTAPNAVKGLCGTEWMSTISCQDLSDPQSIMRDLSEVKLVDRNSVAHQVTVSHLQGLMPMKSAKTCDQEEDCRNVSCLQSFEANISKEGQFEDEIVFPGFEDKPGECVNAQKCFVEYHEYMSGFQRIMDKVCEVWPVEPHVGLKSRFLAEILMDMSTVAVFWAQSLSSSADYNGKDMDQHSGPLCSADNQRGDKCQHAAPVYSADIKKDDINTGLLVSILVPQLKILAEQYQRSLGSDLRRGLHEAKIMEFRGFGPDPAPNWIPHKAVELLSKHSHIGCIQGILNPLFECMWLPWAQCAEFYHHLDVALVCNQEMLHTGLHLKRLASICLSWAIPTRPILEYMISMAPHGKIAEIGSGLGYWAALLKNLGADVVAVDDFSEFTSQGSLYFPETIPMDGEEFIRQGGAIGRALFFCWPLKIQTQKFSLTSACKPVYQTCFVEACLKAFHGDTLFFVGERDDGCTFDIAAWMQGSPKHRRSWRLEKEMEIPTWPGVHDVFMCFVKHRDACHSSTGKKKKRAARKAQLMEEAHSFLSERYAKEEDFLKASIAAYPECSLQ